MSENPAYQGVTVMKVDFRRYRHEPIVKTHNVKRRATLIMLKDGQEVGRVLAKSDRSAIESLFLSIM